MRQRASEACNSCRDAKKRCSGTAPCTHCLRRGTGDTCFISHRPRGHRSHRQSLPNPDMSTMSTMSNGLPMFEGIKPVTSAERSSLQTLQSPVTSALLGPQQTTPDNPTSASRTNEFRPISPSESRTTDIDGSTTRSQGGRPSISSASRPPQEWESEPSLLSAKPSSRMLLNLRGERGKIEKSREMLRFWLTLQSISEAAARCPSYNWFGVSCLTRSAPRSSLVAETATRCSKRSLPSRMLTRQTSTS